jgi:hypothetical protein
LADLAKLASHIVDALLESNKFIVTAITRDDSSSTFPTTVKVQRGDYSLSDFLISALQGQDALIIFLLPPPQNTSNPTSLKPPQRIPGILS